MVKAATTPIIPKVINTSASVNALEPLILRGGGALTKIHE